MLATPCARDGRGPGHQHGLPGLVEHHAPATQPLLLPTPLASDGAKGSPRQRGSRGEMGLPATSVALAHNRPDPDRGDYRAAIRRWEHELGRPAPPPTQPGRHGRAVLAPPWVEWLMGLPAGYVTADEVALPRTQALKVLGNGVVPQQAAAALRLLLCPCRWT